MGEGVEGRGGGGGGGVRGHSVNLEEGSEGGWETVPAECPQRDNILLSSVQFQIAYNYTLGKASLSEVSLTLAWKHFQ